jgi:hypothetical protein
MRTSFSFTDAHLKIESQVVTDSNAAFYLFLCLCGEAAFMKTVGEPRNVSDLIPMELQSNYNGNVISSGMESFWASETGSPTVSFTEP